MNHRKLKQSGKVRENSGRLISQHGKAWEAGQEADETIENSCAEQQDA